MQDTNVSSVPAHVFPTIAEMRDVLKDKAPGSEVADDITLLRFLNARDLNVEKASDLYLSYLKWRESFVPLGYIPETEVQELLNRNMIFMEGLDKQGRAIAVLLLARHIPCKGKIDDLKRYMVYTFDKMSASVPEKYSSFTLILDFQDFTYKNLDIAGTLAVLKIMQDFYPEKLGKVFLINLPYIFWAAWKIVYPFIDKTTRRKIVLVVDQDVKTPLLDAIDEDNLPETYGGKLCLCPIQDVVLPNWPPKSDLNVQGDDE